jgi:hypothetical protein
VHARKIYYITAASEPVGLLDADHSELYFKPFKVSGECVMFILFEVWRLWLAIDGVSIIKEALSNYFSPTL